MLTSGKVLGPIIIAFVIANCIFLHTVWRTFISWIGFFGYSFLFSIPIILFIFWASRNWKNMNLKQRLFLAVIGGYSIYLIGLSTFPFGVNYYFSSDQGKHYSTLDYKLTLDSDRNDDTGERTTTHNYKWTHDNASFSLNILPAENGAELNYNVFRGLLGFDVIRDVEVK